MPIKMNEAELSEFLLCEFPQVAEDYEVESVKENQIILRLRVVERHLRPGGTISGPSMFGLADVSVYLSLLAMIGPEALAVTTNISMDFLRKPAAEQDLLAKTRLLKTGKRLAVGDVLIYSEEEEAPVARASVTYSIPPQD